MLAQLFASWLALLRPVPRSIPSLRRATTSRVARLSIPILSTTHSNYGPIPDRLRDKKGKLQNNPTPPRVFNAPLRVILEILYQRDGPQN